MDQPWMVRSETDLAVPLNQAILIVSICGYIFRWFGRQLNPFHTNSEAAQLAWWDTP